MPKETHTLNIKLDEEEYAALRAIKAYSYCPFTTIVKRLIKAELVAKTLSAFDFSDKYELVETPPEPEPALEPISPYGAKLQYELKLLEAKEDIRLKREARQEAERQRRKQERELERQRRKAEKEAERLDREAKRKERLKHQDILREIRKGNIFAGMSAKDYMAYLETLSPEQREEIGDAAYSYDPDDK